MEPSTMHRAERNGGPGRSSEIADLRRRIETVDRGLIELIARRCQLARTTGEWKRATGLPLVDPHREAWVVRRAAGLARDAGVDEEMVRRIFWSLIELARSCQEGDDREASP